MIYLLGQITACLVLAAIVGWFIGWSWRGFRDHDRVEDARQTLRTTEEIKARELTEAYRQADAAQAQIDTLRRRLESRDKQLEERGLRATSDEASRTSQHRPGAVAAAGESAGGGATVPHLVPVAALEVAGSAGSDADADGQPDPDSGADHQAEAERALRDKTAAVLSLQAQVRALRASTDTRAKEMARLAARLIELEPLEQQLSERDRQIEEFERLRSEIAREQEEDRRQAEELTNRLERELADARRQLQRQIERNRKQDTVHRSVVQDLQRRLSAQRNDDERAVLQRTIEELEQSAGTAEASWRRLLAERDSSMAGLRQQVVELEQQSTDMQDHERRIDALQEQLRHVERSRDEEIERYRRRLDRLPHPLAPGVDDDLQRIRGIGPKLSKRLRDLGIWSFAQIAQWTEEDVERISRQIGAFSGRIQRDDWVQSARRLMQAP